MEIYPSQIKIGNYITIDGIKCKVIDRFTTKGNRPEWMSIIGMDCNKKKHELKISTIEKITIDTR